MDLVDGNYRALTKTVIVSWLGKSLPFALGKGV